MIRFWNCKKKHGETIHNVRVGRLGFNIYTCRKCIKEEKKEVK